MKFFSKKSSIPRSRLLKYATYVCIFTIIWNITEGVVSIFFGDKDDSVSLMFFGVDSFIEVTSASLVLWRFLTESKPDEEKATQILEENLSKERKCTMGIGLLFILLSLATISDATVALIQKRKPETAIAGLIISIVSLSFMGFLWLSKKYLAKMLNSSTMASEAQCSLACIKITFVLFLGSLLYMVWKGGWWVDSTAAIILGILFAKEGVDMILWAKSKNFNGGCCKHCEDDVKTAKKNFSLSFRKFTNSSTEKSIQENIEKEKKLDCCSNNEICKSFNEFNEEKSEKCCEGNEETKQNTCCDKELKDSIGEVNDKGSNYELEISKPEDIESQDKIESLTNGVIFIIIYLRSGPSYYHLTASYTKCTSNNCNNTSSDDLSILNRQTIDLKKITRQSLENERISHI
ncbi:membrane protein [Rhizophagus clarus]|uniref:Membrane protein n=1 Tax=Rhizophagus clarus TaxID=94130 RepID=A0A8H3QDX7_9GLOM|nr:membrane protein [Rhizophagus clarus]